MSVKALAKDNKLYVDSQGRLICFDNQDSQTAYTALADENGAIIVGADNDIMYVENQTSEEV